MLGGGVRWSPAPVTLRYQWYAGSTAIKGAHSSTLRAGKALIGKRLKLRVTASKQGYRTDIATSPSTRQGEETLIMYVNRLSKLFTNQDTVLDSV